MLAKWYADWMIRWETALTTRDTNRVVRPLEWGFDWLADFSELAAESHRLDMAGQLTTEDALDRMMRVNEEIVARNAEFYGYA
ncbi:MAG TPA: abhydrolase domain-containing 18, partial [Terriglobus sp.]